MTTLHITDSRHEFESKHVSESKTLKYRCIHCGIKGTRYGLETSLIYVEETQANAHKIEECAPDNPKFNRPTRIQITEVDYCRVNSRSLKPGTQHAVIEKPWHVAERYKNDVWVLADKEKPVRLLPGEYTRIESSLINSKN